MNEVNSPKTNISDQHRVLKKALDILCGKWRLLIIFQLRDQTHRYSELRRLIPDVSEKMLIQELNSLIAEGVIQKTSYKEMPPRVEYSLTEKARSILPVLEKLVIVGETFAK